MPSEGRQSWRYDTPTSLRTRRPRHFSVTYGRPNCRSKGNAAASAGAAGSFYETTGRRKQRVATAELSVLSKDYGPTGSSGRRRRLRRCRSTCKGLRAGWIRRMVIPEYTAASGRHDHATFGERADESCFADSLEAKARARHRLESGPSESRRLGGTESGPLIDGSGQTKIVPLRARLSDSFEPERAPIYRGRED
jgi:hypothetical protein